MLSVTAVLLLIPAATCSLNGTIQLSAPLPNGATVLNCPTGEEYVDVNNEACFDRGCCSSMGIQAVAMVTLCVPDQTPEVMAQAQYYMNYQIALCRFDGHNVDNVQLQLTPNASAALDSLNLKDKHLRQ
ncbi:hypothetical protein JB92DRAFT_2941568, partial [Gautieria morchelliformis]